MTSSCAARTFWATVVNIAARLEALALPGGVCVSAKVYDDVAHKLDLRFEDIGPQQVKNMARPMVPTALSAAVGSA